MLEFVKCVRPYTIFDYGLSSVCHTGSNSSRGVSDTCPFAANEPGTPCLCVQKSTCIKVSNFNSRLPFVYHVRPRSWIQLLKMPAGFSE